MDCVTRQGRTSGASGWFRASGAGPVRRFVGRASRLVSLTIAFGCASTETVKPTRSLPAPQRAAATRTIEQPVDEYPGWTPTPAPYVPPTVTPPPPAKQTDLRGARVVVDAGHGGKDPGSKGVSKVWEKSITLGVANELSSQLKGRGASVTMTRDRDVFIELEARAGVAERSKADLFVSVHADSHDKPSISGATVYVSRSASSQSRRVATAIERALKAVGIQVRGVRTANFVVLVKHSRPAVLVECGYLTNGSDSQNLNTATYRAKVAKAIAQGIQDGLRG